MSGKTPGQAVHDAWWKSAGLDTHPEYLPWEQMPTGQRAHWEAAAQAGTVTAWRLLDEARAERDRYRKALGEEADRYLVDVEQPAITGAGTEHLVAELAERRSADEVLAIGYDDDEDA